ncbi:MAG: hypothetical protein ABSE51_12330 [Terracidiphilus sp.]
MNRCGAGWTPDTAFYRERGKRVVCEGYIAVSEEYLAASWRERIRLAQPPG